VVNGAWWSRASVSSSRLVRYSASRPGEAPSPISGKPQVGSHFSHNHRCGQNGHLGYQICPALMFTSAERVAFTAGVRAGEVN
jgi:hypothetical protein